jgi:predicted O-methyltransferase YrrM
MDIQQKRRVMLEELKLFGLKERVPNISWEGVGVLRFFLMLKKPKKVLEIGSANGFSSIVIGDAIEQWGGTLLSTDISAPSVESAKKNIRLAQIKNVEIRFGDVLQTVSQTDGKFDFVFIDGEKKRTHEFFSFAESLLSEGGVIVVDDVRKFPEKMNMFWKRFSHEQHNWDCVEIPVDKDDAMLVMLKK